MMKRSGVKLIFVFCLLALMAMPTGAEAMTVEIAAAGKELIKVADEWRFFRGRVAPSDPAELWKEFDFDDLKWETGPSGFGYGDPGNATTLADMQGSYVSVYIRKEFIVSPPVDGGVLQLVIDYDDGFIAYLNGGKVATRQMPDQPPTFETTASPHEAGQPETIILGNASDLLREGKNVLAIEGHNNRKEGSDFSLIPALRTTTDIVRDGQTWIVGKEVLMLRGTTTVPQTVSVTISGTEANFNTADGTWQGEVSLSAGVNHVKMEALDADRVVMDTGTMEILYIPASRRVRGELTEDALWSGEPSPYVVEQTVVVQPGAVLRIEAGTKVMLRASASVIVFGQLLAEGSEEEPIYFTHYGEGSTWGNIAFDGAEASRLVHCIIEYSSSGSSYGGKNYLAAVALVGSHLDADGCIFQKLPEESPTAEGDGIDLSAGASAHINNSRFLSMGEGVHTKACYVLVENCLFTDIRGDNDGVDMDEESDPVPVIRNNLFIGSQDDTIHPDRCSAIITGNVVTGCGNHGIVLRNSSRPYVANNVIYDCSTAGMAIENQCDPLLLNNTIVDCGVGMRLFHLEREGADPGGGKGTARNCVIWNCPQPITLADGSTITVGHSDLCGSGVWPGEGNINANPRFVDSGKGDFHLTKFSPCIDAGTEQDAPSDDFDGNKRPRGTGFDMGAFESPYWPWVDSDGDGMADGWEMVYFGGHEMQGPEGDADRDGLTNLTEYDIGTNPNDYDTDDDGLADGWERSYGFNPLVPTGGDGPLADADGDGLTNLEEYIAGTDPTDGASIFEIADVVAVEGTLGLRWHARAGREYRILVTADQQVWTEAAIIDPGAERNAEWFDTASNEEPRRFYKLKVILSAP